MRTLIPAILALTLFGCATPDEVQQKQIAYFGPACKKLGYTTHDDVVRCVNSKIAENSYFWASQPTTDPGGMRVSTPIPPEPPKAAP